eukprot:12662694-Heterocapsa_arctica.AAC.1
MAITILFATPSAQQSVKSQLWQRYGRAQSSGARGNPGAPASDHPRRAARFLNTGEPSLRLSSKAPPSRKPMI